MLSTSVPAISSAEIQEDFDSKELLSHLPVEANGVKKIFHDAEMVGHSLVYNNELLEEMKAITYDGEIKALKTMQPFIASETFKSQQEYILYAPSVPIPHLGLVVYFLCPVNSANSNMYVVFRGTKCLNSVKRDLEEWAPGDESFKDSLPELMSSFTKVLEIFAKQHLLISVTLCGHSLGASDAQNFCTSLLGKLCQVQDLDPDLEPIDKELPWFKQIAYINLVGLNSPGITLKTAEAATAYATLLRAKNLIQISCYWLHVSGDAVQQAGQTKIFADVPRELVNIHLIKPSHNEITENTWVMTYNPLQAYSAARNTLKAHTSKHFLKVDATWTYEYITNKEPDGALIIANKLSKKNLFLQSGIAVHLQYAIAALMQRYTYLTGSATYSYVNGFNKRVHDAFTYEFVRNLNSINITITLPNQHTMRLVSPLASMLQAPFNETQLINSLLPPAPRTNSNDLRLESSAHGNTFFRRKTPYLVFNNTTPLIRQPVIVAPVVAVEPPLISSPEPECILASSALTMLAELNKYIHSISRDPNKIVIRWYDISRNHELTHKKGNLALLLKRLLTRSCHLDEFKLHLQDCIIENNLLENHQSYLLFKSANKFRDCLQKLKEIVSAHPVQERMRFSS
jgi:hypothetical protein